MIAPLDGSPLLGVTLIKCTKFRYQTTAQLRQVEDGNALKDELIIQRTNSRAQEDFQIQLFRTVGKAAAKDTVRKHLCDSVWRPWRFSISQV